MSEILRDIEKELKRDRWRNLWQAWRTQIMFGLSALFLGAIVLGVLFAYNKQKVESASSTFDTALALQGKSALNAFSALAEQGGVYGALASFHEAAMLARENKRKKAIAIYDRLAENNTLTAPLQDLARLYSAQLALNRAPYAVIAEKLHPAISPSGFLRYSALEVLALAALIDNNPQQARKFLQPLVEDAAAPDTLSARARLMLNKLDSQKEKQQ